MIIFTAKLTGVKRQLTRLRLSFSTKDPVDELVLEQLKNIDGWLAFSEDKFKESVEKAMAERKIGISEEGLSDSQVLRGALFKLWNKSSQEILWDDYYHQTMTAIIKHYLDIYERVR